MTQHPAADDDMIVDAHPIDLTQHGSPATAPLQTPDITNYASMRIKKRGAVLTRNCHETLEAKRSKRKQGFDSPNPPKRPRLEYTLKAIHFDAVFQSKQAVKNHIIIRRPSDLACPGKFYILRCEQHDVSFDDEPLEDASDHLEATHRHLTSSFDSVIKHLGYEVIDCDDGKLEENNQIAREAFEKGGDGRARDCIRARDLSPSPEPEWNTQNSKSKEEKSSRSKRQNGHSLSQINPIPGEIYITYWAESKQSFAGILLPLHDLESVGIYESAEQMGLLSSLPSCYQYDSSSMSFSWAPDYEDNESKCSERYFAFVFFEGVKFPDQSHVGWIHIDDIQEWDEKKAQTIEHSQQAIDYIKEQAKSQTRHYGSDDEIPDSEADDDSFPSRSPLVKSSTNLQPVPNTEAMILNTTQEAEAVEEAEMRKDIDAEPERAVETQEAENIEETEARSDINIKSGQAKNAPPQTTAQPGPDESDQEIILDTQEYPDEKATPEEEPEDSIGQEKPDSPREPSEDRLSSIDLEDLLNEGQDLEQQFSQFEQQAEIDSPSASNPLKTIQATQMVSSCMNGAQEDSQVQCPVIAARSRNGEVPQLLFILRSSAG